MSSREPDGLLTTPERVITYTLTDLVQPKNPNFPVVHVSSTSSETDVIPQKKSRINKHVTGVLAVGTSNLFHTKHESLRQAKKETREELSRLGFTVYVGGPRRIYVIEYDPSFHAEQSETWLFPASMNLPTPSVFVAHLPLFSEHEPERVSRSILTEGTQW